MGETLLTIVFLVVFCFSLIALTEYFAGGDDDLEGGF